MNIEEQPNPQVNTPRPFIEIPGLWLQLPRMTESFFAFELPKASVRNTIYGLLIYMGTAAVASVLQSLAGYFIPIITNLGSLQEAQLAAIAGGALLYPCCIGLLLVPISFYLLNGLFFVSASILGGKGKFSGQAYLYSLFFVPLGIISSLASLFQLIPMVGAYIVQLVSFALYVLTIFLAVRLMKVVHNFTMGRAVLTLLMPLALLVIPACIIGILALFIPAIGNVFSSITTGNGLPLP
jgi:hypothetical protein